MDVFPFVCAAALLGFLPSWLFISGFDDFLMSIYHDDRPAWEKLGSPRGFFWVAKECRSLTPDIEKIDWRGGIPEPLLAKIWDGRARFEKLRKLKRWALPAAFGGAAIAIAMIVIQHGMR